MGIISCHLFLQHLLQRPYFLSLCCEVLLIFLLELVEVLLGLLSVLEVLLANLGHLLLQLFALFPLLLIGLLVLEDFPLTLVDYLQEEVLHQTHGLLVLLRLLHLDELFVAGAHALELLLEGLGVLEHVFDHAQSLLAALYRWNLAHGNLVRLLSFAVGLLWHEVVHCRGKTAGRILGRLHLRVHHRARDLTREHHARGVEVLLHALVVVVLLD